MEIVRKRLLTLGVLMCAVGIVGAVASQLQKPKFKVTEAWMESKTPSEVDGLQAGLQQPADQQTIEELQHPFGIVSRDYRKGEEVFNVMLIASDKQKASTARMFVCPHRDWSFRTSTMRRSIPAPTAASRSPRLS